MQCVFELAWPPALFTALHVGQQLGTESNVHSMLSQGEVPDQIGSNSVRLGQSSCPDMKAQH